MWLLVFSKKKLSTAARTTLQSLLEDVSYTCGASLEDLHLPMGIQVVFSGPSLWGSHREVVLFSRV